MRTRYYQKLRMILEKVNLLTQSYYGIRGFTNSWFRSYLFRRKQFVEISQSNTSNEKVNTYRSPSLDIEQGVPQSGFGGLKVACWPLVPKFAGSNPAEAVGFFRAKKKSSARLPSEGK